MGRYLSQKLRQRNTYAVALVAGTVINLYTLLLVPWLRGETEPIARLAAELAKFPWRVSLAVVLAYSFPLAVGTLSAVMSRYGTRRFESRAMFANSKPDPVFRADRDGSVVDMGDETEAFFFSQHISTAQAVLGSELWERILRAGEEGTPLPRGELVYSSLLEAWYLVSSSDGPEDTINIYMTKVAYL